jgi:hypothetical protein
VQFFGYQTFVSEKLSNQTLFWVLDTLLLKHASVGILQKWYVEKKHGESFFGSWNEKSHVTGTGSYCCFDTINNKPVDS